MRPRSRARAEGERQRHERTRGRATARTGERGSRVRTHSPRKTGRNRRSRGARHGNGKTHVACGGIVVESLPGGFRHRLPQRSRTRRTAGRSQGMRVRITVRSSASVFSKPPYRPLRSARVVVRGRWTNAVILGAVAAARNRKVNAFRKPGGGSVSLGAGYRPALRPRRPGTARPAPPAGGGGGALARGPVAWYSLRLGYAYPLE